MTKPFIRTIRMILDRFPQARVLVVGDVILDLYVCGEVRRISPEAPVPVIVEDTRSFFLGGAGNVARNVASLGGMTTLVGVVGRDEEAKTVRALCRASSIRAVLIHEKGRPTSVKLRAVARRHQLLRIDREITTQISRATEKRFIRVIRRLPQQDIVVVSDYAKGCVTRAIFNALSRRFGRDRVLVGIKPASASLPRRMRAIVLNLEEARELTGRDAHASREARQVVRMLAARFQSSVVLTRGERGMTVFDRDTKTISHVPSHAIEVFDVTGAGDTALAVLALMLACGASITEAAGVANRAAGIVVGIPGTAAVTRFELRRMFLDHGNGNGGA